jgi:hypothetical protein
MWPGERKRMKRRRSYGGAEARGPVFRVFWIATITIFEVRRNTITIHLF